MQISELNDSERAWLKANLEVAAALIATYGSRSPSASITPESLDSAWNAWVAGSAQDPDMANAVVNATGAAFGQFLADADGFRWVVASDGHGTEMAVIAREGTADVVVYPMNLVGKRYAGKEQGFILPVLKGIRDQVSKTR